LRMSTSEDQPMPGLSSSVLSTRTGNEQHSQWLCDPHEQQARSSPYTLVSSFFTSEMKLVLGIDVIRFESKFLKKATRQSLNRTHTQSPSSWGLRTWTRCST
jgi:hypothetical protein